MVQLSNTHRPQTTYILKKNIQRQQGLFITPNLSEIQSNVPKSLGWSEGYVIAQEVLRHPLTIDKHKINFRFYLAVVCHHQEKDAYLFNDGFVSYTPKRYEYGTQGHQRLITTVYMDRHIYKKHPLTISQFIQTAVPTKNRSRQGKITYSVSSLLHDVLGAIETSVCRPSLLDSVTTFQMFGCDVEFDEQLLPKLIELNKGLDLSFKDDVDRQLKVDLVDRLLDVVDGKQQPSSGRYFFSIWSNKVKKSQSLK
eukprot:gb/GECG01009075.1/.p1 GENE.gb/GECG01009075.1/~~gb/GECG01009075.1/.p1  ORF type:complete len:253 (+),score=26.10 gb/GECG01009075.1/:1-759(+)